MNNIRSNGKLTGYIRKDVFGRLFIDRCATDEQHLTNPPLPHEEERPGCRKYFEDLLVPEEVLGKKVTISYNARIVFKPEN